MALDEAGGRLFIGCRRPAHLAVLDTASGRAVGSTAIVGDTDDLFYDRTRQRLYVIGGEGFIDVIQRDGDTLQRIDRVATPRWRARRASGCPPRAASISPFRRAAASLPEFAFSIGRTEAAFAVRSHSSYRGPLEVSMAAGCARLTPSLMTRSPGCPCSLYRRGRRPARQRIRPSATSTRAATSAVPRSPARRHATRPRRHATMVGSGTNMWLTRDEFQFAWRKLSGDFILRTHAAFPGQGVEEHRKLGWIIRSEPGRRRHLRGRGDPRQRAHVAAVPRASRAARPCQLPSAVVAPDVDSARAQREDVHHVGRALRRAVHAHRADRARSRRRRLRRARSSAPTTRRSPSAPSSATSASSCRRLPGGARIATTSAATSR